MLFHRKHTEPSVKQPSGVVAMETSACTGERLIGFRNPKTGRLEQAVLVRSPKDVEDFYLAHGLLPEKGPK